MTINILLNLFALCPRLVRFPGKNFRLDYDEIKTKLLQDVPNSFVELAIVCSDYEPEDRPLSVDAVEWIADLLKMLQPDEEDQPESKEEPEVEEDDLTSVTVRNSTLGVDISEGDRERRNSESSAASSSTTKEDERKVGFAVTKQISDRVIKGEAERGAKTDSRESCLELYLR